MDQPRHAKQRITAKNHRIQPLVGNPIVNHLDVFKTRYGFQINGIVQDEQISALHQRNAHSAREKAMLGVDGAAGPGGKQHDGGIRMVRKGPEQFKDVHRRVRN